MAVLSDPVSSESTDIVRTDALTLSKSHVSFSIIFCLYGATTVVNQVHHGMRE